MEAKGAIYEAIPAIMAEVGAISKDRQNKSQGYSFRGIDDVYAALQGLLAKHKVFTVPEVLEDRMEERQSRGGGVLIYRILKIRYRVCASDGSYVEAVMLGEGMDSGDKGSNKAMSVAHKYLFLQLFAIPTDDPKDPENDSHDVEPRKSADTMRKTLLANLAVVMKGDKFTEDDRATARKRCHGADNDALRGLIIEYGELAAERNAAKNEGEPEQQEIF